MLAGPLMHTVEGILHASTNILEFDREKNSFLMRGIWRNSYEAENHLRLYGQAKEPVCWTLSGYASGFGTGFMGSQVICVETMCQGMGDPYCRFELRTVEAWNGAASRNIEDLKQCLMIKSLQRMLEEESPRKQKGQACRLSHEQVSRVGPADAGSRGNRRRPAELFGRQHPGLIRHLRI